MHLYLRIAVLMAFAIIANCSDNAGTQREAKGLSFGTRTELLAEAKEILDGFVTLRDGRRFKSKKGARLNFGILDSLLDIIDFSSGSCSTGQTCMSQKECLRMNGTDSGDRCVEGFGVCCIIDSPETGPGNYTGGNVTIGPEGGVFTAPTELDGERPGGSITVDGRLGPPGPQNTIVIAKLQPSATAVQIKIDINNLYLYGPTEGDCVNDTLEFPNSNSGQDVPILCGRFIEPQTLYIDIDPNAGPFEIVLTYLCCVPYPLEWNIGVSFLTAADAVTPRCLQYLTKPKGTIRSFNFDAPADAQWGQMINDLNYPICFGYVSGFCDIHFTFTRLDLGSLTPPCEHSYLLIGAEKLCGDSINGPIVTANATGPITVGVRSGGMNEIEAEGFLADYMMLPCP